MATEPVASRRHVVMLLALTLLVTACVNGESASIASPTRPPKPTTIPRSSPTATASPSFETGVVTVYKDPVGSLRFLFEIQNVDDHPVERTRAEVVLLDNRGNAIASRSAYARLDLLPPGKKAPVLVIFFLSAPEFATYAINVRGHRADYLAELLHPSLWIVDASTRVGEWVPYEVLGEVHNTGDLDAEAVTLAVTCHGDDGGVVAVGSGRPTERQIPAGGSSPFLISIGAVAADVDSCEAQVEGLISSGD